LIKKELIKKKLDHGGLKWEKVGRYGI